MTDKTKMTQTEHSTEELIHVTTPAAEQLKKLMAEEKQDDLFVRLGVGSGGCSGMSYLMEFDNQPRDADLVFEKDGVEFHVEDKALAYLKGATVDYTGGLLGGGFSFTNPNAKRSCGCGTSFTC